MMRVYAIGDIHGQCEMLRAAHQRVENDRRRIGDADAPLIHLGDLTDRGPDSKGVLDLLISGIESGQPWRVLKGNHDRMFAGYLRDKNAHDPGLFAELTWLDRRLGGVNTLASYGVKQKFWNSPEKYWQAAVKAVPKEHLDFIENLPLTFETPDLFLCHAGVRPGVPLNEQVEDDLLWIRQGFLDYEGDLGKLIVHGHTAVQGPCHYGNRVALDTGAGYGRPITAAVFEGRDCFILTEDDRVQLFPPPAYRTQSE